jgi:hypothetical protein
VGSVIREEADNKGEKEITLPTPNPSPSGAGSSRASQIKQKSTQILLKNFCQIFEDFCLCFSVTLCKVKARVRVNVKVI